MESHLVAAVFDYLLQETFVYELKKGKAWLDSNWETLLFKNKEASEQPLCTAYQTCARMQEEDIYIHTYIGCDSTLASSSEVVLSTCFASLRSRPLDTELIRYISMCITLRILLLRDIGWQLSKLSSA